MEISHVSAGRCETSQPVYVQMARRSHGVNADEECVRHGGRSIPWQLSPGAPSLPTSHLRCAWRSTIDCRTRFHSARTVAIGLIGRLTQRLGARLEGALDRPRPRLPYRGAACPGSFSGPRSVSHHDDGIADLDFGVHYGAIGKLGYVNSFSAKSLLGEVDQLGDARDTRYGLTVW